MPIDYKEKIRKLLALSQSPNENEAKEALLKARKLMAEHKLSEMDFENPKQDRVIEYCSGFRCTQTKNSWMPHVAMAVAENYGCEVLLRRKHGKKTSDVYIIGLESDLEICKPAVTCAFNFVLYRNKTFAAQNKSYVTGSEITSLCNAYGFGFASVIKTAFEKQTKENQEYGLVCCVPPAVIEATAPYKKRAYGTARKSDNWKDSFRKGVEDGEKFDPKIKSIEYKLKK